MGQPRCTVVAMRSCVYALLLPLLGCPKSTTAPDAGPTADAPDATPVATAPMHAASPPPRATNWRKVDAYGDQNDVVERKARIKNGPAKVRVSTTKDSGLVSSLSVGTEVIQIAERVSYFLVIYDEGGSTLEGWLPAQAFLDPPSKPAVPVPVSDKCPAKTTLVWLGDKVRAQCKLTCYNDQDCTRGTCESTTLADYDGNPINDTTPVCVVGMSAAPRPPSAAKCGPSQVYVDTTDMVKGSLGCATLCTSSDDCAGASCGTSYLADENGKTTFHDRRSVCMVVVDGMTRAWPGTADGGAAPPTAQRGTVGTPIPAWAECPTGFQLSGPHEANCDKVCKTDAECGAGNVCKAGPVESGKQCQKQ